VSTNTEELRRLIHCAIDAQWCYYSGDVVIDNETFWTPVLSLLDSLESEPVSTPNRGDEVQIQGWIGNIVRMNDREGTCSIAWWMPTGGPFGSEVSDKVPLEGLHVRQRATTSR
jgi:hypothetical protein